MRALLWLVLVGLVGAAAWVFVSLSAPKNTFPPDGTYVEIPRGASRRSIARILADQGIVRNRWVFEGLTRFRSQQTLQAGEYHFDRPVSGLEVFDTIANGRVFVRLLVVPEGYSIFEIADLVAAEQFTSREEFLAAAQDPEPIKDLAPGARSLEGFLFPATYQLTRHPSGKQIVAAMVGRFRQQWQTLSAEQGENSAMSVRSLVTLASLVERETPKPEERALVAGVFTNRLQLGLPLQCDPTVVYALQLAGRYRGGPLQARDLPFESPYNTYRHAGLPPGPIANPGEASLRAALAPAQTDYLYFVANTEGGHFFSASLAEHNRNVARYRQRLTALRDASSDAARTGAATTSRER